MRNKLKYIPALLTGLLVFNAQPVWAAGPPAPSPFNNPLAITLMVLMLLLLIVIGILGNILVGTADFKMKKKKKEGGGQAAATVLMILGLLASPALFAQDAGTNTTTTTASGTIGGMSSSLFYIMAAVIFLELFIIIAMLINIKFLLKVEKEKYASVAELEEAKKTRLSWWDRFNKLKPVSQESELDLGHEYDGIRELNNRLPPWWLYGFYLTIVFAGIYLWRFHVSGSGPSSEQEYNRSVERAELRIKEYLKAKGDAVDENTVKWMTDAADVAEGKVIFEKSCVTCHLANGGGSVGPNLTDDYWLHGNSAKDVFKVVKYGINAMPTWQNAYNNKQIAQVISYVKTLHGTKPAGAKAPDGVLIKEAPVADTAGKKPAADTVKKEDKKLVMN